MRRGTKSFFLVCLLLLSLLPACQASENQDKLNNNNRSKTVSSSTFLITPTINLTITHTVKEGETPWKIARDYSLDVSALLRDNHLKWRNCNRIKPGDKLVINFGHLVGRTFSASYYGPRFNGRIMANGRLFNINDRLTVAHKALPLNTWLLVENPVTREMAYCQVRDRGPYIKRRDFDLSTGLAKKLEFKKTQLLQDQAMALSGNKSDKGTIPLVILRVYPKPANG